MHPGRLLLSPAYTVLLLPRLAVAQSIFPIRTGEILLWSEYFGMAAIGWGTGVTAWLITGHKATECLFVNVPRAWRLRRKNFLTSSLPVYKYLVGGGFFLVIGAVLVNLLWGSWTHAFDVGLFTGVVTGAGNSFVNARMVGSKVDFLEANQRYLNENQVTLFSDYDELK